MWHATDKPVILRCAMLIYLFVLVVAALLHASSMLLCILCLASLACIDIVSARIIGMVVFVHVIAAVVIVGTKYGGVIETVLLEKIIKKRV